MIPYTYTVSREILRHAGRLPGEPRRLLRSDGVVMAIVSSPGPAAVGQLSEADAQARFSRSIFGTAIGYTQETGEED